MVKQISYCRHNWIFYLMLTIGLVFIVVGCAGVYRALGVPETTANQLGPEDEAAIAAAVQSGISDVVAQVATGTPITTAAVSAGSTLAWKLATIFLGGAGTILSTLLAKWFGTEKKINTALIRGIEKSDKDTVKKAVQAEAMATGVESKLHTRVVSLTSV